jgi:hypothetical protein
MKLVQTNEYIRIGDGGGFAGKETVYTVYMNRQLEQSGKVLAKIEKADFDQLIGNVRILGLDNVQWNKPGNLYKFIEYTLNGKSNKITWDSKDKDVNANLNLFYNHMNYLIQKSTK